MMIGDMWSGGKDQLIGKNCRNALLDGLMDMEALISRLTH